MINNENEKILENVKLKISISNFDEEEKLEMKKSNRNIFKIATVACCMLVLTTGLVFAKDIEKFIKIKFGTGRGIDSAAENGYVEEVKMEPKSEKVSLVHEKTGKKLNDLDISVEITDFLMDDFNLSSNINFKFDEKISEVFNLDELQFIFLNDLIIFDENGKILLSTCSKEDFEKMCNKNNLNHKYREFNENYMDTPYNTSMNNHNKEENIIKYALNLNADKYHFPYSKELNFAFSKIEIFGKNSNEYTTDSILLTGNWKINIKVPEKMYSRSKVEYKVINSNNENFQVYSAFVSETGFEFGVTISNVTGRPMEYELRKLDKELYAGNLTEEEHLKRYNEIISSKEYVEEKNKYDEEKQKYKDNKEVLELFETGQIIGNTSYITNTKGEKFYISSLMANEGFIDKNTYDYIKTFEMSKFDATEQITVTLIYKGEIVNIELEKINSK